MEPLTEKHRSKKDSFSEDDDSEDDIIVHGEDDGPSTEDRQLLNEEDEREKLLTKRRKVLIGSKKDRRQGNHARRKSIESYMEDGTLNPLTQRRSKIKVQPAPRKYRGQATFLPLIYVLVSDARARDDDGPRNGYYVVMPLYSLLYCW